MEQTDLSLLVRLSNPYVQSYFSHIQKMIFHLNQKRVIQQLGAHPLLGVLQKAKLDRGEILRALKVLRANLIATETEFSGLLDRGLNPNADVSRRAGRGMLDYLSVTESTLGQRPELCGIANELMAQKIQLGWIRNIGLLAGTGVLLFTAPVIAVTGFLVIQAYTLTDAALTAHGSAQRAFTNPVASMNFASIEEAYMDDSAFGTEAILSPLAVTGISLFKVSKLRGILAF